MTGWILGGCLVGLVLCGGVMWWVCIGDPEPVVEHRKRAWKTKTDETTTA